MFSVAVNEQIANNDTSDLVESKLQEYTELNNIFTEILAGENYQNIENPVLNIARSAVRPSLLHNSDNKKAEEELKTIESALTNLKSVLDEEEYVNIASNLRSSEFNQSLGALTHIRLYDYLKDYEFEINPEPFLSNDKCSDLELCQDKVIVEVTSLGNSMIKQEIESMLESIGSRMIDIMDKDRHLSFNLKVEKFSENSKGLWELEPTEERIISQFEEAVMLQASLSHRENGC